MKSLQFANLDLDDIAYNFLVGGDAKMYEGRGFEYQGQHTQNLNATEFNSIGICIAFIGNYTSIVPSFEQFDLLRDFIDIFVKNKIIANDYIVVLQDDLQYFPTKSTALNNVMRNLQNYRPCNLTDIFISLNLIFSFLQYIRFIEERNGVHRQTRAFQLNTTLQ